MNSRRTTTEFWPGHSSDAPVCLFPGGALLFRQGDLVTSMYFVTAGVVKLYRMEHTGRDALIGIRGRGWLLGAASAILERPHLVSAVTAGPCELEVILAHQSRQLRQTSGALADWLQRALAYELLDQTANLALFAAASPRDRLVRMLVRLAESTGTKSADGVRLYLPLTHLDLAEAIGTTREYVSRLVGEMTAEGVLLKRKGALLIPVSSPLFASIRARHRAQESVRKNLTT